MDFKDFLMPVLAKYHLSEDRVEKYAIEFAGVVFLSLLPFLDERMSPDQRNRFKNALEHRDSECASAIIDEILTKDEWEALLESHIGPLVDEYMHNVIMRPS